MNSSIAAIGNDKSSLIGEQNRDVDVKKEIKSIAPRGRGFLENQYDRKLWLFVSLIDRELGRDRRFLDF